MEVTHGREKIAPRTLYAFLTELYRMPFRVAAIEEKVRQMETDLTLVSREHYALSLTCPQMKKILKGGKKFSGSNPEGGEAER